MTDFIKIDRATWKRTPYFEHFFNKIRCSFSMTVNIDITELKSKAKLKSYKLYPLLIYALTTIVNRHDEFRTSIDSEGNIGIWQSMNPAYTVFNKEKETFCELWSEFDDDIHTFIEQYNFDVDQYGNDYEIAPKPNIPANTFPISALPWTTFTSFNLNIYEDGSYLLPIFTWGKSYVDVVTSKLMIPLACQVHHAVCDGFHLSRFIEELQNYLNEAL